MADDAAPRHATTLSSLSVVHEQNKLNKRAHRVHEFPLRKQGAVISLSGSRDGVLDGVRDGAADAAEPRAQPQAQLQQLQVRRLNQTPGSRKMRKISSQSVPEGKDALVLLHNGNHGDAAYFLAEDDAEEEDDDEDDEDDEDDDVDTEVAEGAVPRRKMPDGGWGWAVVAAAFFINMASDGISFSFGLLYIEFLRYFGESRSTTSWIGSLFMAVPMLTGPVASAMVDRYGCRTMTIVGGIISAISFVIAASSTTIGQMYLTFGVLAGLGLGLCFVTAVVSIAFWFERKRTLAMSIGAAGTGFGTSIYARMTNFTIREYGWRGTVLLLGGTFLNLCVAGVVMRDPPWWIKEQRRQGRKGLRGARRAGAESTASSRVSADATELLPMVPLAVPLSRVARSLPYTRSISMTTRSEDNLASTVLARHPASAPQTPSTPLSPGIPPPAFNTIHEIDHAADEHGVGELSLEEVPLTSAAPSRGAGVPGTGVAVMGADAVPAVAAVAVAVPHMLLRRSNSSSPFSSSPLRAESLPCFRRRVSLNAVGTPLYSGTPGTPTPLVAPRRPSSFKEDRKTFCCPGIFGAPRAEGDKRWYSSTVELVRAMLDFSLFLELHFLLMSVGTTLLYTWFIVPYFYLADHLMQNGYTESQASVLLGVIGVANTCGMLGLGFVGDNPRLNVTKTYALCLVVCGSSAAAMLVFTDHYWALVGACAAFGVTFGSTFSFTPTILVTLVPMERFTIAYGLNLLCQGIGNLLGPPFAGWLYDLTKSWDLSFYMAGMWIVVAGVLTGLISYTNNKHLFGSLATECEAAAAAAAASSEVLPTKSTSSVDASAVT
ncbi:monocarboxylate transporter 4-like [Thrips palmi]|uniref:Monocarboxylate transporter 4-like n=1 Tax=Thrips palmi TaxID=161013 RepID=A0A6P8ZWG3_THRPL|nr:monocarboxylate transporter 4-like [Thrips palmi]